VALWKVGIVKKAKNARGHANDKYSGCAASALPDYLNLILFAHLTTLSMLKEGSWKRKRHLIFF